MSAHVSLNLLNDLGRKIRCKALPNEFNKFDNTGAQMQDSVYHNDTNIALNISKFCT